MKVCSVCGRCYEDSDLSCAVDNQSLPETVKPFGRTDVANYRLESLIESTPTGDVYRASQTILRKDYLIRIIDAGVLGADQGKAILADARKISAVIHPGAARIFESGTLYDGSVYIVSELFDGQTLRECLDNVGAPDEVTAVMIVRQTAEALEALHASGVAHRNLRPENIILLKDARGELQIKLLNPDPGGLFERAVQATGDLYLNALRYFSPEQCEGKTGDAQSDAYALGVMFHELLDGAVPFDSPYADALVAKHLNDSPPSLSIERFDIRMLITHTLADALQKQTRLRIKSASAFARRLRHIEQLATHSSTPPPVVAHLSDKTKPKISFAKAPRTAPKTPVVVETDGATASEPELVPIAAAPFEAAEPLPQPIVAVVSEPIIMTAPTVTEIEEVTDEPVDEPEIITEEIVRPRVLENAAQSRVSPFITQKLKREDVIEVVYPDLSTTKLPPIEAVIKKSTAAPVITTTIESFGKMKKTVDRTGQPILVAWEQPDDVPSVTQALGKKRKELADAAFAKAIAKFLREEEEVETKVRVGKNVPPPSEPVVSQASILFRADDSRNSRKGPGARTVVAGAGILVVLVLSVSALFVGRSIWASDRERRVVTQPKNDQAPVSTAPDRVAVMEPAAQKKTPTVAENEEVVLPEFTPREAQTKSSVRSVVPKKVTPVKVVAEKTPSPAVLGKTGEPEKTSATITRPRVVKMPK